MIDLTAFVRIVALALALAAPVPAAAQKLEPFNVRLYFSITGIHAPIFLAKEMGWFKDAGLDVDIQNGTGSTNTVNLVGAGNFDVGEAALPVVAQGRQRGLPIKAIACLEPLWEAGVLVPRTSGIESPRGLAGKKVLYGAGSFETPFLDIFFANVGIDRSQMELVNIEGFAKISAYASGQGDAVITFVPLVQIMVEKSRPSRGFLFKDFGLPLSSVGYFATEKTIKEKPAQLRGFVAAISRAVREIRDNGRLDDAVAAIIKHREHQKLNAAELKAQWDSLAPYLTSEATRGKPPGWQARTDWELTIGTMQRVGMLKGDIPLDAFYTNEFVPAD